MRNIIYPSHEPKRLVVVRLVMVFIIFTLLVAFFIVQAFKLAHPSTVYQLSYRNQTLPLPTLIFFSRDYGLLDVSLDAVGSTSLTDTGFARGVSLPALKRLAWGEDVLFSANDSLPEIQWLAANAPVWCFQPSPEWRLIPPGWNKNSGLDMVQHFTQIQLFFQFNSRFNVTSIPQRASTSIDIFVLENSALTTTNAASNGPLDLSSLGGSVRTSVQWNSTKVIKLRHYYEKSGSQERLRYELRPENDVSSSNRMRVTVEPLDQPADHSTTFTVEIREARSNFTAYDFAGTMGGALTLAMYVYAILFGQRRLRPWGIIQRFIMRNRILSELPRAVAEIGTPWSTRKHMETGHDSALDREEKSIEETTATLLAQTADWQPSPALPSDSTFESPRQDQQNFSAQTALLSPEALQILVLSLAQEVRQLKAGLHGTSSSHSENSNPVGRSIAYSRLNGTTNNSPGSAETRVSELEAFRQRMEAFYVASDLFREHGKTNKRTTLQIISELNL